MNIIPTAEPFYFPGGPTGCLLIHGFTGTPKEMLPLGEYLAEQGHTVLAPRLFGHATRLEDMNRARWEDWVASVEDGWHILEGATDQIFVLGLSMGGVLSLYVSSQLPVAGTVAMSTPYEIPPDPRLRFLKVLWRFFRQAPKEEDDWQDPSAGIGHISYPTYPTRGVIELQKLMDEMRAALPTLTQPVLLIHSRKDGGVSHHQMPKIHAQVGSAQKEMLWLENSGHVITRDAEKERVFKAVEAFIQRVGK
ncbi:MAG: Thermostable monoacylglycerol lipase [Chloroflexi bacterium]|nr:Thermostable monoacylglycerol lipase [Chloroflexota bacterium]